MNVKSVYSRPHSKVHRTMEGNIVSTIVLGSFPSGREEKIDLQISKKTN
jgi:hypothetical protein